MFKFLYFCIIFLFFLFFLKKKIFNLLISYHILFFYFFIFLLLFLNNKFKFFFLKNYIHINFYFLFFITYIYKFWNFSFFSFFSFFKFFKFFKFFFLIISMLCNNFFFFFFCSIIPNIFLFFIILILCLNSTLIIASLTLVERKILSLLQRRVGPNYVGYRGRLQYIADALKLLLKGINVPNFSNKKLFLIIPCLSLIICYTFWWNTIWGPSISILEIEYNLVYLGIMSIFFSFCIINISIFSKNKYSIISAIRSIVLVINLEIFLSFFFLFVVACSESFSFSGIISIQSKFNYFIFIVFPLLPLVIISFLLETGRAPFDLLEAESELIAGYSNELGGFFFALFYLAEYFHLFFFSLAISCIFFGGYI